MSAKNLLDVLGCMFLLMSAIQMFMTAKTHRGFIWKSIRLTSQVSLGGAKVLLLIGGLIGLASAVLQPLLSDWIPPLPALLVIGASLLALNGACQPPTFLFLAASRERGFLLASDIELLVPPLKLVHLLNSFEAGVFVGDSIHYSEFRVSNNWQQAVRTFSVVSPAIIVDIRELTSNVYQEIVHLAEAGLHNRVFLVADGARAPEEISRLCQMLGIRICIVSPQLLRNGLSRIGWTVLFHRVDSVFHFLEARMVKIADASYR
ncbi:MAG: hypothetical protein ABR898_14435 [Terracidiphilus sp.]|jgi:hypothetical protein